MADKDLDTPILSDEEMDRIGSMSRAMVVRGICYSHNGGLDILATECEHCRKEERDFDLFEAEKRRRRAVYARSIATAEQRALHRKADNAVPVRYKGKGFEDFETENEGQKEAAKVAKWFLANANRSVGLVLLGKPGTGKTLLASIIAREAVLRGKEAMVIDFSALARKIKGSWRPGGQSEEQVYLGFTAPDLLVIDEIGHVRGTDTEKLFLGDIVNARYNAVKPTILISNLNAGEFKGAVGDRLISRFRRDGGKSVIFDWMGRGC